MNTENTEPKPLIGQSLSNAGLGDLIPRSCFSVPQLELYELMSAISEECYFAGWLIGNEYHIWGALQDGDRRYGMGEMDAESLERCRELAATLDGWIVWVDDDNVPGMHSDEWGPRFIPMGQWLKMLTPNVSKLSDTPKGR